MFSVTGVITLIGRTENGNEIGSFTEAIPPKRETESPNQTVTLYKVVLSATEETDKIVPVKSSHQ
ncbi:TPA: hypothetical protein DIC40_00575 [Patescibacteria group bacterium]|nr:hypothetical protein [Candidatus Gracilibacteria bacterium]